MAFISTKKTFFAAAISGDIDELKYGLDANKYSIDMKDAQGNTATHLAAVNGQMEALKFLLERKPDLEVYNSENKTPLLAAASANKSAPAIALVAAGAKVNTHNEVYTYPLHWAAHFGDLDFVKALVTAGAELDVRTKDEEHTPTYYAVDKDRGAVLEFLVAKGARTDIPGADNKTPYENAKESKPRLQKIIDTTPRETTMTVVPAPAAANENAPAVAESTESWVLMNKSTVAKAGSYPALNRKLTEIFNFETEERLVISENLATHAETMGAPEKFDSLAAATLKKAKEELLRLGGRVTEDDVRPAHESPIAKLRV